MIRKALATAVLIFSLSGPLHAENLLRMAHDLGNGASTNMDPYDPNRFWPTMNLVYDALVTLDPNGKPLPRLATDWSASADLKTWTFHLRDGVLFQDGSTFDAADVVWSYGRMTDPKFDSPVRAVLGIVQKVDAVDPHTVRFQLSSPEADFPQLAGDYRAVILPDGMTAEKARTAPIGTGPFRVETLAPDGTTRLVAFDKYYLGRPKLDAVEITAIPDSAARLQAMIAGQLDMLLTIDPKQERLFAGNPAISLQHIPSGDWNAIDFQTDVKPFDDPRVRKALRIAVDRKEMTALLLGEGNGVVSCDTPIWSGDPYRWNGDCPQDIEGAKRLLAEAGYKDGIDVEIATSDVEENMVQIVEVYQQQVARAGIRVKLKMTSSDGFWDDVWMKVPAFVDSWGQRPATQVLNEVFRSTASWNTSNWRHKEFDAMLDAARAEPDFARRKEIYGRIQKELFDEGGVLIPYHKVLLRAISTRVKGIEAPFVTENIDWHTVTVE